MTLTQTRLKEVLDYDLENGVFIWKHRVNGPTWWNAKYAGSQAGSPTAYGYVQILIDHVAYRAHRLAWFYVHGRWPDQEIDHINLKKSDNRLCNLREATISENRRNVFKHADNKSGFKGVCWHKASKKWIAQIAVNHRRKYLGIADTPEAAHKLYCEAAQKHYGKFARTE